jgi:hypothetical protein
MRVFFTIILMLNWPTRNIRGFGNPEENCTKNGTNEKEARVYWFSQQPIRVGEIRNGVADSKTCRRRKSRGDQFPTFVQLDGSSCDDLLVSFYAHD